MRLLFGIESAALAHAADGQVLDPLNLAYQRDVDGCADACFVWRAAVYDAFRSGQSVDLASNDQSKCFDRFQFGVQLLQLRLLSADGIGGFTATALPRRVHAIRVRSCSPPQHAQTWTPHLS